MKMRFLLALLIAGCGPALPPEPNARIREWGDLPAPESVTALPAMARVCAGLHHGLVTQANRDESDLLIAPDLENVCGRSIPELSGDCRAYAEKARDLGLTATTNEEGTPAMTEAEREADAAFYKCWR